jgi:glutamine synthetase
MASELDQFLAAHPGTRFIDLLLHDLNGVDRGKRVDLDSARSVFRNGLLLPGSMFALDVPGGTVQETGLGFDEGDADRPCLPIAGSLVGVPWLEDGIAQAQVTMHERDGLPFAADPRHLLARVLERFRPLGLTPVVAVELEFYLIDRERNALGLPQPPRSPITGQREYRTQINSMMDLDAYSAVLTAIDRACHTQHVPSTTALAEYGPGQFEVNLAHSADALGACDQAARFKRIVKCVARHQGISIQTLCRHGWQRPTCPCESERCARPQRLCVGPATGQPDNATRRGGPAGNHARWHGNFCATGQFVAPLSSRSLCALDGRLVDQQSRRGPASAG